MELTTGYRAAPGCCSVCGSADSSAPVVDVGIQDRGVVHVRLERVYLCMSCAAEVGALHAKACGVSPLREQLVVSERIGAGLLERAERAEALLRDLREFVP